MSTWAEQSEAGLGDNEGDIWTTGGVEETSLAEDEHQVPAGWEQQAVRYSRSPAWGCVRMGYIHRPTGIYH